MKTFDSVPYSIPAPSFSIRHTLAIMLAALLLFMAAVQPVRAEESAGVILAFTGKVEIMHGTEKRPPANRAVLYSGDTIVTGDGQVQIRFADGTLLTLYRDTRFAVDDYRYDKGKGDRAQFSLLNGVMHTLTGQIDKRNYLLKTRLANLGVRGTEYSAQLDHALHVSVDQGRVELANAGGTVQVGAGQSVIVRGPNEMPKPSTGGKIDLRMHGHGAGGQHAGGGPGALQGHGHPPPPPAGSQNLSPPPGVQPPPPPPGGGPHPPPPRP